MDWIDKMYTSQLETRVRNFKWTSAAVANFSCPICGDSTDKRKARGYIMAKKGIARMYCHNCGASLLLGKFLETVDVNLAAEYRLEKFKESRTESKSVEQLSDNIFKTGVKIAPGTPPTISAPRLTTLPETHFAREYVRSRLLEEKRFFFVENFPGWVSSQYPAMIKWKKVTPHPRLILPIYSGSHQLIGMTARSFGDEIPKYATIKLTEEELVYGLDKLQLNQPVWVVEGPIDSMMLDNGVAAMTSALSRVTLPSQADVTYIYDNQPRNPEIVKLVEKAVFRGDKVVIFPDEFIWKDLNEARQKGVSRDDLHHLLTKNSFRGLEARMKLHQWKKV